MILFFVSNVEEIGDTKYLSIAMEGEGGCGNEEKVDFPQKFRPSF